MTWAARLGHPQAVASRSSTVFRAAEEFVVLAHEYAHELLHHADDRPASRDTRELEAEAVAFVVGEAVGLDTSRAVTRLHPSVPRRPRGAAASLDRIQRAAAVILTAVSDRRLDGSVGGRGLADGNLVIRPRIFWPRPVPHPRQG